MKGTINTKSKGTLRALTLFVTAIIMVTLIPLEAAASQTSVPAGFKGVYTVSDLYNIRNNLNGSYILMNDIDLSKATAKGGNYDFGNGWEPIGTSTQTHDKWFQGSIDGNGYQIKGLNIYGEMTYDKFREAGLVGYAWQAEIKNIVLVDCNINVSISEYQFDYDDKFYYGVGSILGDGGYTNIENCFASGSINVTSSHNSYIGGICGYTDSILNCYSNVKINVKANSDNINKREINVGGISALGGPVNCYSTGTITTDNRNSVNSIKQGPIIGKFIKRAYEYYRGSDCYYLNGMIKSNDYPEAGKGLSSTQMKSENSFINFDFKETWYIDKYCGYLYPQLISAPVKPIKELKITSKPNETTYIVGENFDATGGELEIIYRDGITVPIEMNKSMLTGFDMDKIGVQSVKINLLGQAAEFDINVNELPVQKVTLSNDAYTINQGTSITLKAQALPDNATNKKITWSSNNTNIAKVTDKGVVTGIKKGTALITAKSNSGVKSECKITVIKSLRPSDSIKLSDKNLSINLKDKTKLKITLNPSNSTDTVMWQSSDKNVATVTSKGTVTAKGEGECVITATTSNGLTAKCKVTVSVPFVLSEDEIALKKGNGYTIKVISAPSGEITYKSSDKKIVTVGKDGTLTTINKGTAVVMVMCNGETQILTVNVK